MSRNVVVAIVGSGKTTRSNVESLLGDFRDAVDLMSIVISESEVTEGVLWAKQYSLENDISVIADENIYTAISRLSLLTDPAVELKLFLLWDDDDSACQEAMHFAQKNSVPVFDLTDGLVRIPTDQGEIAAPDISTMPTSEVDVEPAPVPAESFITPPKEDIFTTPHEPLLNSEDLEDLLDDAWVSAEVGGLIVEALQEAGKVFAKAFVTEMVELPKAVKDDEAE